MLPNEWEYRQRICQIGQRLYSRGYVAGSSGNISVRLAVGKYLCTPTLISKGFMVPDDIALVDDAGEQISGRRQRTSEVFMHLEIYHELPEVQAVVHAHPPYTTAFAITGEDLPIDILPEIEIFLGRVPIAPYATPGTKELARTIVPYLHDGANTIILANHGVVACSDDLERAYFQIEMLEHYCQVLLIAKQIGDIRQIPPQKIAELMKIREGLRTQG